MFATAARADVTPTLATTYGSTAPGAHGNITYSIEVGGHTAGNPVDPSTYDDIKGIILDGPAGFVGNLNAVPYDQRCTAAQYGGVAKLYQNCPASSIVGSGSVMLHATLSGSPGTNVPMLGSVYMLQSSPELPAYLALSVTPDGTNYSNVTGRVEILTGSDYRMRITMEEDFTRPILLLPGPTYFEITNLTLGLFGALANGNVFLTNPTRCDAWNSYVYTNAYDTNTNLDTDTNGDGVVDHRAASSALTPDCTTLPQFAPTLTTALSSRKRGKKNDVRPGATFTVNHVGSPGSTTISKTKVAFPAAIGIKVANLVNQCKVAERDGAGCPANTQIGSVTVTSPLISLPLTGPVYLVEGSPLPELSIQLTGLLSVRLRATNATVDGHLETTFENLPQLPQSQFVLSLTGGTNGLLTVEPCPTGNRSPLDGPISYTFTGHTGQTSTGTNDLRLYNCTGVTIPKPRRCVDDRLKLKPSFLDRKNVKRAVLYIGGRKVATKKQKVGSAAKNPFIFRVKLGNRFNAGSRYKVKIKATYKSGRKAYGKTRIKICR